MRVAGTEADPILSPMPALELKAFTYGPNRRRMYASGETCRWSRCSGPADMFVDESPYCYEHAPFYFALLVEEATELGYAYRGIEWCRWCQNAGHTAKTCPDLLGRPTADGPGVTAPSLASGPQRKGAA